MLLKSYDGAKFHHALGRLARINVRSTKWPHKNRACGASLLRLDKGVNLAQKWLNKCCVSIEIKRT